LAGVLDGSLFGLVLVGLSWALSSSDLTSPNRFTEAFGAVTGEVLLWALVGAVEGAVLGPLFANAKPRGVIRLLRFLLGAALGAALNSMFRLGYLNDPAARAGALVFGAVFGALFARDPWRLTEALRKGVRAFRSGLRGE
jgi:hypothetical protein